MKKLLIVLLLPIVSLAQKFDSTVKKVQAVKTTTTEQKGYVIKGNLKGLKDSTLVFLQDVQGATVAQDYAKNGKFKLSGKSDDVNFFQLCFIGSKETTEMFLANDNVTVTGSIGDLKDASFVGSAAQTDYKNFVKGFLPINDKLGKLVAEINAEKQGGKKKDSLIALFNENRTKLKSYTDNFLKVKAASPVSAFLLYQFAKLYEGDALEEKYKILKPEAKKIVFAKEIERMIGDANVGKVGSIAKDFTQNDTANKPVSLSSFRGKYVLVDFWASWCRPCRMENPNVLAAYNEYKDKNFTVLGVSLDKDKASWIKAITDDKLPWTHISDLQQWGNAAAKLYKIESIPSNMLIDPSGKIIGKNLRGEELLAKLKETLK
jgi:peroxiredoxin